MKISTRLMLLLTLVVGAVMTVGGYFILRHREIVLERAMRNEVEAHAKTLQLALESFYRGGKEKDAHELIEGIGDSPRGYAAVLFSDKGEVVSVSDQLVADEIRFPPEVNRVLATGDTVETIRTINNQEVFSILMPVRSGDSIRGVFEIALPMMFIRSDYARARREIAFVTLALFIIIIFVVALVTRYSLLQPIDELLRGATALGRGDLDYRVIVPAKGNEFAQLEREFNRMADNLEEQRNRVNQELEKRLRLERELRHSEHLASVGRLASGVAHEIGTPLNVIEVRAEQILNDLEGQVDRRRRNVTIIISQIERIAFIVRQLLNLARPYKLQRVSISLNNLIASTLEMLEANLASARVVAEIQNKSQNGDLRISGDKELLRQVLNNLIVNAVHAMPNGGRLVIEYGDILMGKVRDEKNEGKFVALRFSDTGTGIKTEHFPQLFDPFFTTKDVGSGVGLGLPVSRRIIEEHGGWIEAANNDHGGAVFTVYLQLADEASCSPESLAIKEKAAQ